MRQIFKIRKPILAKNIRRMILVQLIRIVVFAFEIKPIGNEKIIS